jgi:hypothetical protein
MRLASLLGELASRDQEIGAAVTLVMADPADPARRDVLTSVLAARAEADPLLAEGLREVVHGVEEDEEIRLGLERDLQFAAHQRLVARSLSTWAWPELSWRPAPAPQALILTGRRHPLRRSRKPNSGSAGRRAPDFPAPSSTWASC